MVIPIALALMAKGVYDKTTNDSRAAAEHEEDRQFAKMKQEREVKSWQDEDNYRAGIRRAVAPASIDPNMVKAEEQDNRDVGQPGEPAPTQQGFRVNGQVLGSMADAQKTADTYNAPSAVNARMSAAALQAGRPVEAQQLRSGARQEQVADLQVDQLKQAAERDKKLREVGGLIKKGWPAVAEVYARYDDGMNAKVEPDGKGGATVIGIDGSGKEVSRTKYASLPDFFADVVAEFDPTKWIGMHEKKTERAESERRWNAEMDLRTKSEARRAAHDDRIAGIAERKAAGATSGGALWTDKDDAFIRKHFSTKDQATGQATVDAGGMRFAKELAFAGAQANGGDTTSSIAKALEADAQIRASAGNDPKKIEELRQGYLDRLYGRQPKEGATKATATATGQPTQQSRPAAQKRPEPQLPPDEQALAAAKQELAAAAATVQRYGSRQRQADPEGFKASMAAVQAAQAKVASATEQLVMNAPQMSQAAAFGIYPR
ncbi:hypothetical protein PEC18_18885 [Paucibacter sp. O1-1]|nr:hypothetical protein [Paucibacter sp. O1-1]MDA3827864.1 hypothetical protein [Paucibacter sp. O1-1]